MTPEEATLAVFDAFASLGIPFMVVGSLSSNVYGIPRSTKDADFVVELGRRLVVDARTTARPGLPSSIRRWASRR